MVNLAQQIRMKLIEKGMESPYGIWRAMGKRVGLHTVYRYFHILRRLGLIELAGTRTNSKGSPIMEHFYRIKPGRERDPCWDNPWYCYWKMKGALHRLPEYSRVR